MNKPRVLYGALLAVITTFLFCMSLTMLMPVKTQAPTLGGHTVAAVVGSKHFGPTLPPHPHVPLLSRGGSAGRVAPDDGGALFVVTAYTAGEESTGKRPGDPGYGIAADGKPIESGECACDRRYPFGTRFYVEGVGTVVCTDRGGAIVGNHIDLYVPDLSEALRFGKKLLMVRVLK